MTGSSMAPKSWITHGNSGNVAVVIACTGEPRTQPKLYGLHRGKRNTDFLPGKRKISWACVLQRPQR